MGLTRTILLLAVSCLSLNPLQAGPIPGRWEKVEMLRPGTRLIVVLKSGEKYNAQLIDVHTQGVVVEDSGSGRLDLPKDSIKKLALPGSKDHDRVWNGLWIGAAAGAGTFLTAHFAYCCAPDQPHDLAGAALFASIGMGLGALIDAAVTQNEVVFRAR